MIATARASVGSPRLIVHPQAPWPQRAAYDGGCPVLQVNDLSRSLVAFDPISTLMVVVEMSKASWLVRSVVPGVERQPLKKLEPDATALLRLIERWRSEAVRAGRPISRVALAYEAGRDGFWLARWLIARGIEAHVIHSASVAVHVRICAGARDNSRPYRDSDPSCVLRARGDGTMFNDLKQNPCHDHIPTLVEMPIILRRPKVLGILIDRAENRRTIQRLKPNLLREFGQAAMGLIEPQHRQDDQGWALQRTLCYFLVQGPELVLKYTPAKLKRGIVLGIILK